MSDKQRSTFDPSDKYADMRLLYPSYPVYRTHAVLALVFKGFALASAFAVAVVIFSQLRLSEATRLIDPTISIVGFILAVALLRKKLLSSMPLNLFYDQQAELFIFIRKDYFSWKMATENIADLEQIEIAPEITKWAVTLFIKGGRTYRLPLESSLKKAKMAAGKVGGVTKVILVEKDIDGKELSRENAGEVVEPLYIKLKKRTVPMHDEKLKIDREKIDGGMKWGIPLPNSILAIIVALALVNIVVGIAVMSFLDESYSLLAGIPFFVITAMLLVLSASLKTIKRPLTLTMKGITHRGVTIPLEKLEEVYAKPGFFYRLEFISPEESVSLLCNERQGKWLKQDVEFALWERRGNIGE